MLVIFVSGDSSYNRSKKYSHNSCFFTLILIKTKNYSNKNNIKYYTGYNADNTQIP